MRYIIFFLLCGLSCLAQQETSKLKTIHTYVALCDNENQGIVPVSKALGDGQNPFSNLYWGALYGVKTHFKNSSDWTLIANLESPNSQILERVLFKHKASETYLLADAYDGAFIEQTTKDFLKATSGDLQEMVIHNDMSLGFGGNAGLIAYIGHDGLMEFNLDIKLSPCNTNKRDAIILACISKDYFKDYLKQTKANPLVWSTGLMSPEAYTLKWAIDGWILEESDAEIRERAAQSYNHYQHCGINGARRLLVTGF